MKRIILDTNFLLAIGQFHIDVFSELQRICDFPYSICVLDKTIDELNNIISIPGKKGKAEAKLALNIIKGRVDVIKTKEGYVDDILAEITDNNTIISTQDKELQKRIKTRIIIIKQKKYLIFKNP